MMTILATHRASRPLPVLLARLGFLTWMLGVTVLYWLLYGAGAGLVGERLPMLLWARQFLLQFFTARYVF